MADIDDALYALGELYLRNRQNIQEIQVLSKQVEEQGILLSDLRNELSHLEGGEKSGAVYEKPMGSEESEGTADDPELA